MWHPTRAGILELLKAGPATKSELAEQTGTPRGEVAYHLRTLLACGCIEHVDQPGSPGDDRYEAV